FQKWRSARFYRFSGDAKKNLNAAISNCHVGKCSVSVGIGSSIETVTTCVGVSTFEGAETEIGDAVATFDTVEVSGNWPESILVVVRVRQLLVEVPENEVQSVPRLSAQ